jgi:hypothetical protein
MLDHGRAVALVVDVVLMTMIFLGHEVAAELTSLAFFAVEFHQKLGILGCSPFGLFSHK